MTPESQSHYVCVFPTKLPDVSGAFADVQITTERPRDAIAVTGPMNIAKATAVVDYLMASCVHGHLFHGHDSTFIARIRALLGNARSWPGNIESART